MKKFSILVLLFALCALTLGHAQNTPAKKRIMLYGDSNTWGFVSGSGKRFPKEVRWTGVLAKELGNDFEVIEEGLTCRTTNISDEGCGVFGANVNGALYLPPAITSHAPLDLVVIMLGTNDMISYSKYNKSAKEIATSLMALADTASNSSDVYRNYAPPKVLLISPVPLGELSASMSMFNAKSVETSKALAGVLEPMAKAAAVAFFDAAKVVAKADGGDGVHLSAQAHGKLGVAFAAPVKNALK